MNKVKEIGKNVNRKLSDFLAGRPMWVYWVAYTSISGLVLASTYALSLAFTIRWWVSIGLAIFAGILWGTSVHRNKKSPRERSSETSEASTH